MKLPRHFAWILLIAIFISAAFVATAYTQDENTEIVVPEELASARAVYETLRDAIDQIERGRSSGFEDALLTFDLSGVPEIIRVEYGKEIARKLSAIMSTTTWPDAETFSDDPTGRIEIHGDVIEPSTKIFSNADGWIEILHTYDYPWHVTSGSIRAIPIIYHEMELSGQYEFEELAVPDLPEGYPTQFSSPRGCYEYFVEAIAREEAGEDEEAGTPELNPRAALDFTRIPVEGRDEQAGNIVRQLGKILSAIPEIDPVNISNDLTGPPFLVYSHEDGKIEITLNEEGRWLFSQNTVAMVPDIYIAMIGSGIIDILEPLDEEVTQGVPESLATPRHAYQTYYMAMTRVVEGEAEALDDAIECLDLSEVPGTVLQEYSAQVAKQLGKILDNIDRIDPEELSNDPSGPFYLLYRHDEGLIEIAQSDDGAWRFSVATVAAIPEIHREMEISGYFEERLLTGLARIELSGAEVISEMGVQSFIPATWRDKTFILEDWQWIFLIFIILIGMLLDKLVPAILSKALRFWFKHTFIGDKPDLILSTSRPFGFLAMSGFWWIVLGNSGLELKVLNVLLTAVKFMTAAGFVWCAYRSVDVVSEFIERQATETTSRMDDLLAPFVRKSLKVLVTVFGIVFVASNINIDVTSLVAGLGIGGLALALAAQDTLSNLFGSLTVLFDRPFQVGDWVVIGGDIEGTVEELGFRSTRIRTFYNSVITVPNAKLISVQVDNLGERRYRRIKALLSLTYNTQPDKIEAFCEGIRELIRTHPYTRKDYFHVWLNQFGGSSLDVLLYCFVKTPDWSTELREKHRLFLDILRLAKELGIEFAFPTQTIYMAKDDPDYRVFPDEGDIKTTVFGRKDGAGKIAKEIAFSELGGEGVIPPKVQFRSGAPMDHSDGFEDGDGDG